MLNFIGVWHNELFIVIPQTRDLALLQTADERR